MRRFVFPTIVVALLAAGATVAGIGSERQAAEAEGLAGLTPMQQRLVSGFARSALEQRSELRALAGNNGGGERRARTIGCAADRGSNVRVNQTARTWPTPTSQGRAQAQNETTIAQDPNNPRAPGGRGQRLPPRRQQLLRVLLDATAAAPGRTRRRRSASRAATAFGGTAAPVLAGRRRPVGRLGQQGQRLPDLPDLQPRPAVSQNPDLSSAFYVFRSTGTDGASWNFPGRPVAELNDPTAAGRPARQAVHDGRQPPRQPVPGPHLRHLDAVRRRRHGLHLRGLLARLRRDVQRPEARQRRQRAVPNTSASPTPQGRCNTNQFSQPFTGPDGALYVVVGELQRHRCGRARVTTRAATARANAAPPASTTAPRCCWRSRPTAATRSRRR